ncbi:MAG TPA: hypothetical protein VE439_11045 [Anaerolineae bacterium]|nr:hypothetical protein [Anaerolineae bacterium]
MSSKNILKLLVITALIGLVLVAAIGCQDDQPPSSNNQAINDQNNLQEQVTGPRVLLFSAEW